MAEIRIRNRGRLKEKVIERLADELRQTTGTESFSVEDTVDRAESSDFDVIFVNGEILAIIYEDRAFSTVRGLLEYGAEKREVTVDMGAVPYVVDGADVMAPGIVEADTDIQEGDLVWVSDQKNGQPLAIGEALMSGQEMIDKQSGRAIKSVHYVGDKLWEYDEL